MQASHWTITLPKRWLIGAHVGAVSPEHLQGYLDEFLFCHNRRKTAGVACAAARVIERVATRPPLTPRALVETRKPQRRFASVHAALDADRH